MENKVSGEIFNPISENIKKLAELFPAAVKDGQIDFDVLRQELGQFEEAGKEKYELTWPGKMQAKQLALTDLFGKTLKYVPEESKNPDTTENLYIEGDNLEVLKLLRNSYYGKIKMIYIDPPYNTGNDFIYKDDFKKLKEESDKDEGELDESGERLIKNQRSSARFHSNWLNMMYPRLRVAKDLLSDDGLIFISIDDNEVSNLKKICDEVFGEENFLTILAVKMSESSGNKMSHVDKKPPKIKEYVLMYKKAFTKINPILIEKEEWDNEYNMVFENFSIEDKRKIDEILNKEDKSEEDLSVIDQILSKVKAVNVSKILNDLELKDEEEILNWKYENAFRIFRTASSSSVKKLCDEKKAKISQTYFSVLSTKERKIYIVKSDYSKNAKSPRVQVLFAEDYFNNVLGDMWVDINTTGLEFEGEVPFKNGKKPLKLIKRLIKMATERDKNHIILDFFSGSATTAEATMRVNAEDNGNRKYIMVQYPEELDKNDDNQRDAYEFLVNLGKGPNIANIGKERIYRSGEQIKEEYKDKEWIDRVDIGFKVFRVAKTNIRWNERTIKDGQITIDENCLSSKDAIDFNPGFTDIDVVYEIMLRHRDFPLTSIIEKLTDIGNRTYIFAEKVVVCLEETITDKIVDKIALLEPKPIKIIFRDSAFDDDISLKLNILHRLDTKVKLFNRGKEQTYRVEFI